MIWNYAWIGLYLEAANPCFGFTFLNKVNPKYFAFTQSGEVRVKCVKQRGNPADKGYRRNNESQGKGGIFWGWVLVGVR
jgi:hypothetical protein